MQLQASPRQSWVIFLLVILTAWLPRQIAIAAQSAPTRLVELTPFDLDPKQPERKQFGALTLMAAFELSSKDKRFGGISGLSFGSDDKLYAVSDRGYWLVARPIHHGDGALSDLTEWQIAPLLAASGKPVSGSLVDAEALTRDKDGSFLVAFERSHRIWRYDAAPNLVKLMPTPIAVPPLLARAPSNGGIEALSVLPDGRLLALSEDFANSDGSFKGWLLNGERFAELSYVPAKGYRVTDGAALKNGDVLVLERRYVPLGILSVRLSLVDANTIQPGAKLAGKELLKLEAPLVTENFEALAVQETTRGTMIYLVSDDNYNPFQQTLLLQFLLPSHQH